MTKPRKSPSVEARGQEHGDAFRQRTATRINGRSRPFPTDAEVAEAMTHSCGLCKAKPGEPCVNVCDGSPLVNRPCHFYRIEP